MRRAGKEDLERKRTEQARLLRNWLNWHRDQRESVLAGPHRAMFERLLFILKGLAANSQPLLLAYIRGIDWSPVDDTTRQIVLHEIGTRITKLRIEHGLAPFDDDPDGGDNVFRLIKQILFPPDGGANRGEARPMSPSLSNNETDHDNEQSTCNSVV